MTPPSLETAGAAVARLRAQLDPLSPAAPGGEPAPPAEATAAAVLAPVIERPHGLSFIFTVRAPHLRRHAGQVSFPGGRIETGDDGPAAAAVRESCEEIGLRPSQVELLGRYEPLETITGFHVTPFVGLVDPAFAPRPDPSEVAEVFEAPFAYVMDAANHTGGGWVEWRGERRRLFEITYRERRIWGATALLLKALHNRLYG